MSSKTSTVYTFYTVGEEGYISEEYFVHEPNEFGELSYYKFPRDKYDFWKTHHLGCEIFETKKEAAIEANAIIDVQIKSYKAEIASIEKEIKVLEERASKNLEET